MKLQSQVNCGECPKLCCYSLARPDVGFSHRSDRPSMCRHCDIISEKGCRIHTILHPTSRNCDAYTCYGIGTHLTTLFGLDPRREAPQNVQHTFRQRQGIAFYLWGIKAFLEEYSDKQQLQQLRDFVHVWENTLFTSRETDEIRITDFVSALNICMREANIGYDKKYHQFCFLPSKGQ